MYGKVYFKLDDDVTMKVINVLAAEVGGNQKPKLVVYIFVVLQIF